MVGIGPFIPHRDTPFKDRAAGSALMTLKLLAIIRLLLPTVLLPATTALNTLLPDGCEQGMLAGANVVMPNLSPQGVRKNTCSITTRPPSEVRPRRHWTACAPAWPVSAMRWYATAGTTDNHHVD